MDHPAKTNRPFYRCGGHFDFYCFEWLLWDAQLPPEHPIMSFETIEIKMATVSAKRSIGHLLHRNVTCIRF